jgi:hypothetical protein
VVTKAFFDEVADVVVGFVVPDPAGLARRSTARNVKVWFGDDNREHYEAQFLSAAVAGMDGGGRVLEVGFHAEHPDPVRNTEVVDRLAAAERRWRRRLGAEAVLGPFLGRHGWIRLTELWDGPVEGEAAAVEVAERLALYIEVVEPLRRPSTRR